MTTEDLIAKRRQARVSQRELAAELNISERAIQYFEAGGRLPWATPLSAYIDAIEAIKARRAAPHTEPQAS